MYLCERESTHTSPALFSDRSSVARHMCFQFMCLCIALCAPVVCVCILLMYVQRAQFSVASLLVGLAVLFWFRVDQSQSEFSKCRTHTPSRARVFLQYIAQLAN